MPVDSQTLAPRPAKRVTRNGCGRCNGTGRIIMTVIQRGTEKVINRREIICCRCGGNGRNPWPPPNAPSA